MDRKIMSMDRKTMSLDRKIISMDRKMISLDRKAISPTVGYDSEIIKNRLLPDLHNQTIRPPHFVAFFYPKGSVEFRNIG
jgi:hypothetical protein